MTFLDPRTAKSPVDIVNTLEQTSRKWETEDDLRRAITDIGKQAPGWMMGGTDEDFIIRPVDWSKLASASGVKWFLDMRQNHDHGCALNAVRFVLQRRFNVMIGQEGQGDRIVYCLTENAYVDRKNFEEQIVRHEINLTVAKKWLAALGIQTRDPVFRPNIAEYINQMRAQMSGMFLVSGDLGADHTFVLYEFRTVAGKLEAKVYNPWTGMHLPQPTAGSATDWYDVGDFQTSHGLPLLPDGQKIPNPTPGGSAFLRPLDPALPSNPPLHYGVMFVPAL